jgi:hypothetical protein
MSRSRTFRLTALSGLVSLSLLGVAHAQSYNVATDWKTTYATTAAVSASTHASWGAGNAWSSGTLSYNWTNQAVPNYATTPFSNNVQFLQTYYNPSTAVETSGASTVATFTYTVPFQAYQLNPGSTIHVATSPEVAAQVNSGFTSSVGGKVTLPASGGSWVATGNTTSATIAEVGQARNSGFVSTNFGFGTVHASSFSNGLQSVQSEVAGTFYNYSTTNSTGSLLAGQNAGSGSLDNVVNMLSTLGPSYTAWTAPSAGTLSSIAVNAWDLHESGSDNDGFTGFAIYAGTATTLGSALFSALNTGHSGVGSMQSYVSASVGTANANIPALNGYATNGTSGASFGVGWTDASLAVTAGEVLYFIADPGHSNAPNDFFQGAADPVALQAGFIFTAPEPSSIALLGMAGVGLALAAWRRRRAA